MTLAELKEVATQAYNKVKTEYPDQNFDYDTWLVAFTYGRQAGLLEAQAIITAKHK